LGKSKGSNRGPQSEGPQGNVFETCLKDKKIRGGTEKITAQDGKKGATKETDA